MNEAAFIPEVPLRMSVPPNTSTMAMVMATACAAHCV